MPVTFVLAQGVGGPKDDPPTTAWGWILFGLVALAVACSVTWVQWYRKK